MSACAKSPPAATRIRFRRVFTAVTKPRIGLLGIMQELYDDMIPGITAHQDRYAHAVADPMADVASFVVGDPVRNRTDAEQTMHHAADWRDFCLLAGIAFVRV